MKKKTKKYKITQPIYDFQANDIYDIMIEHGISKIKATEIIQSYINKNGLLEWKEPLIKK